MKRIRVRVLIIVSWLFMLFCMDQLLDTINLGGVAYAIMLALLIISLLVPKLSQQPVWVLPLVSAPILLGMEWITGEFNRSNAVLLTLIELCSLFITIVLSRWVNQGLVEFEKAVDHITIGKLNRLPENPASGSSYIYREIRRARNHQRPLVLMALSIQEKSIKLVPDKIVQEAQASMMKQYALSGVSKTLCEKLEDCDIIVQNNDQFLVALPETRPEDMPRLMERIRSEIYDRVGVIINIGTASMPDDGFTLDGLIQKATQEMNGETEEAVVLDLTTVKHEVS